MPEWRPIVNISPVASSAVSNIRAAASNEASEKPGPDHDGDADDMAVNSSAPVKAAVAQGVGQILDMMV